jgi:hypothetical protein
MHNGTLDVAIFSGVDLSMLVSRSTASVEPQALYLTQSNSSEGIEVIAMDAVRFVKRLPRKLVLSI